MHSSSTKPRKFAVVGNPVAHSKSPAIHAAFAAQTGLALTYERICAPLDDFETIVNDFFRNSGTGLNITVPFKEKAWLMARSGLSDRARLAGAVNTLWTENGVLKACNTDGVGLLADLRRLNADPAGKRILLVGAGGASKGVAFPLLETGCKTLHIINRTASKATSLVESIRAQQPEAGSRVTAGGLDTLEGRWDIVINATSSSISDQAPAIKNLALAPDSMAYDMFYASQPTAFMHFAQQAGASRIADGLGMLVGQAAASFQIWNGIAPDVEPVLTLLRQQLQAG